MPRLNANAGSNRCKARRGGPALLRNGASLTASWDLVETLLCVVYSLTWNRHCCRLADAGPPNSTPAARRAPLRWRCVAGRRAGLKLEAALERFGVDVAGLRALDAGLSTGGFADCLLQRGAAHVVGVDVGYGQVFPQTLGRWPCRSCQGAVSGLRCRPHCPAQRSRCHRRCDIAGMVGGYLQDWSDDFCALVLPGGREDTHGPAGDRSGAHQPALHRPGGPA